MPDDPAVPGTGAAWHPSGNLVAVEGTASAGVFVVDAQGVAHYRMVRVGEASDGQVEIQAGLTPGERVATSGTAELQSGDKIANAGAGSV